MKRIISIILVLVTLFSISCFAVTEKEPYHVCNWEFGYVENRECYELMFMLKDINKEQTCYPIDVYIYACDQNKNPILKTNGTKFFEYSKHCTYNDFYEMTYKSSLYSHLNGWYCILQFKENDLPKFNSSKGYIALELPDFDTIYIEVDDFPCKPVKLKYPTGFTFTDDAYYGHKIVAKFSNVKCEYDNSGIYSKIKFTCEGNVTARKGNSGTFYLDYQIYDSNNYMIERGTMLLDVPKTGKFKQTYNIYLDNELENGKTYTIKFQ